MRLRKWIPLVLSVIAMLALPVAFMATIMSYNGPGSEFAWLILLSPATVRYLPFLLLLLLPLLIPIFNTLYTEKKIPKLATFLQLSFFLIWFALIALTVNSFTYGADELQAAYVYSLVMAGVIVILLIANIVYAIAQGVGRKRQGQKFFTKSSIIVGIILAVIAIGGLCTYAGYDAYFRGRFNSVKQTMDSIETKSIIPAGGKRWEDPMYHPTQQTMGNGLMGMTGCNATVSCPYLRQSWLVPIEPGKEQAFINDLLLNNGFGNIVNKSKVTCDLGIVGQTGNTCAEQGTMGIQYIAVHLEGLDGPMYQSNQPQLTDVAPRVWRSVIVDITRTWGN